MSSIASSITQLNNNTNLINAQNADKNKGKTQLDNQGFLQLLMAKLQFQDPTKPADDGEFLQQQAILAQTQSAQDLTSAFKSSSAMTQSASLVGKTVDILNSNQQIITGKISSASFANGTAGLSVNGNTYTLDQVTKYTEIPQVVEARGF